MAWEQCYMCLGKGTWTGQLDDGPKNAVHTCEKCHGTGTVWTGPGDPPNGPVPRDPYSYTK